MLTRRQFGISAGAAFAVTTAGISPHAGAAELSDDGLHIQDWFLDSFMELPDDLTSASDAGKHFAVIVEQRGCPYCKKTHEVNFAHPKIREYIPANFDMLQLNLHGSREVIDFDGEAMEERALARKWLVNFTPTIVFFSTDLADSEGKSGRAAEVARLPGYFRPFTFMQMFKYVREDAYKTTTFQSYLAEQVAALEASGIDPDNW